MFKGEIVFFRTDASFNIGTGHVMRCLTLAKILTVLGAKCHFITRAHQGNIASQIEDAGFICHLLPPVDNFSGPYASEYAFWLGCSQQQDALESMAVINDKPDWLIVDHYALDEVWESLLKEKVGKLLVIDDLANRRHQCDLLLDQNFGHSSSDYQSLIPPYCRQLYGPQFALLRPEFAQYREESLVNRKAGKCKSILVTMGGIDKDNITLQVLEALKQSKLPPDCKINIVMGITAPGIEQVKQAANHMPWKTNVLVGVTDMAARMASSDLAIGAAGSTTWERCALGLPTIMVVIADNQSGVAKQLEEQRACLVIWKPEQISSTVPDMIANLIAYPEQMLTLTKICSAITDGAGASRVAEAMSDKHD